MPKNIFKQGIKLLKIRPPTSSKSSSSSKVDINRNPPRFSKTPESTEVYYFTYAGNLLKEIIENRKSKTSAKFVGIGLLRNHKLVHGCTKGFSSSSNFPAIFYKSSNLLIKIPQETAENPPNSKIFFIFRVFGSKYLIK